MNTITNKTMDNILNDNKITVLDFWAPWCGPCKLIGPTIDKLQAKRSDIFVGKVNVDDNSDLASRFKIRSIPTIMFFKGNEKVAQVSGNKSLQELETIINNL